MLFPGKQATLLFIILLTIGNSFFCQGQGITDSTRLEKRLPVLNKKIYFDFPANAIVSPRVTDIMAADPNENRETRIIADWVNMKLVIFAKELFALSGKTLFEDISKEVEPDFDFQRKILTDNDSIISVLSTPTLFDSTANGILINSFLVKTPDNTVCRIDAYINPAAYSMKDQFISLTESIFKTISKGTRSINLEPRDETCMIQGGNNKFLFKLPRNYFITIDEKYDFSVFKLTKYRDLTDKNFTSITIYSGFHPSWFHKEYGYTDSNALKTPGRFLQKNVDWLYFSESSSNFYLKEQIIPSETIEKGLLLHVALLTNNKDLLPELEKMVDDIKVIK